MSVAITVPTLCVDYDHDLSYVNDEFEPHIHCHECETSFFEWGTLVL